jgi:arginine N-succinyltransferase
MILLSSMLLLRDAQRSDLPGLASLAAELDSVNLPDDPRALGQIVARSMASFSGRIVNPLARAYVFVAEAPGTGRLTGTSMVIAKHGTRESPCTFFTVAEKEHYSSSLDRHFRHIVLSLGYHFDGPTEIGGLVVRPGARRGAGRAGTQLSLVRFLYLAMHPRRFRQTVLAELMGPLTPGGQSAFWEAFGRRFTGLDYQVADKLSRQNKEFIQQLFPPFDVYASLLPPAARRTLGAVGSKARPVRDMLTRIGFRDVHRIDPFDGGPHYEAPLAEIAPVKAYRSATLEPVPLRGDAPEGLVARTLERGPNRFRAVRTPARLAAGRIAVPSQAARLLGASPGERLHHIPFG